MSINKERLISELSDNIGQTQAEEVIEDAIDMSPTGDTQQYSEDEAMEVLEAMKELEGAPTIVGISANTIQTRIRTGDI